MNLILVLSEKKNTKTYLTDGDLYNFMGSIFDDVTKTKKSHSMFNYGYCQNEVLKKGKNLNNFFA